MRKKYLWAPWRSGYILGKKERGCIFCNRIKRNQDRKDLIAFRGSKNIVILNKFPYNSGHAMIVPNRHIASLGRLTDDEAIEFFDLIRLTVKVMKNVMRPMSFNIGMNLGQSSGAGIPTHLHMHVVPRWSGDTNFMPIIGDTKVVSFDLDLTWRILKEGFDSICSAEKSRQKRN